MLGSLAQFFACPQPKKQVSSPFFCNQLQSEQQQDVIPRSKRYKSVLHYETADKSALLQRNKPKRKSLPHNNHQLLSWAFHADMTHVHVPERHWVEKDCLSKNKVNDKNKLLRAIIKTKQLEQQDHTRTLFQKSVDRVLLGFSKIKTQPVNSLLPATCFKEKVMSSHTPEEVVKSCGKRFCTEMPDRKLLELEKSIKWAKKHKKNFNSFYQQLGKSVEVVQKQSATKNNYQLQKQQNSKKEQSWRRRGRQNFLKQIQKRIRDYEGK